MRFQSIDDQRRSRSSNVRRGVVLIIVLVVVAVLALSAYTFSSLMVTHHRATKLTGQRLQARLLVDSAVEAVKYLLQQDEATREEMGGLYDNPLTFQGVTVLPESDLESRGSFAVISPLPDTSDSGTGGGIRYGLEDESGRLNLNLLLLADQLQSARDLLMGVPGMTEEVADAILDWIDEDDEPREYGAELEHYSALNPAYEPRNGPLLTVEELLLVRGVTPELLFGQDQNRNTMMDAHEMGLSGGGASALPTASLTTTAVEGMNHRGWSAYFTLYSAEKNSTTEGLPRIHLNGSDMQALHDELVEVFSEDWANFIVAYRLYGPYSGGESGQSADEVDVELDLSQSPTTEINQVLDLIGVQVQIGGANQAQADQASTSQSTASQGGGNQASGNQASGNQASGNQSSGNQASGNQGQTQQPGPIINSPFADDPFAMASYLQVLMDNCTVTDAGVLPGRINVNEAPPEILAGIPGMTDEIVEQIVDQREVVSEEDDSHNHEAWLLAESIVTLQEMKTLLPFVCAGGDVFRTQIIGYYQGGGPSARAEIVFDATESEPRVVLWRDISHLGRGYALEMLGVDLRAAQGP